MLIKPAAVIGGISIVLAQNILLHAQHARRTCSFAALAMAAMIMRVMVVLMTVVVSMGVLVVLMVVAFNRCLCMAATACCTHY